MEHLENNESKERILKASIKLFSEKGFDAARVNEIAEEAEVNKALIYYYFKSKEDILDYLIDSFFESVTSIALDFINDSIINMLKDGLLDIEPDRFHFTDKGAMEQFIKNAVYYYDKVIEYAIENRHMIRILMVESLKNGKHQNVLFRLLELTNESESNPAYKIIKDADKDFRYSKRMVLHKFFFSLMPVINFAVYYDDYKKRSSLSDEELRDAFKKSLMLGGSAFISDMDILMI